ncbi:MAG: flavoprotein [Pontiellaceae bacterium]
MKKKVLLAVSGGIAAYKSADLASQLVKSNFDVYVCMTVTAEKFITPLTFEAITGNSVHSPNNSKPSTYSHLYPATEVDIFIISPATANILAKVCYGHADDPVSSSALSLKNNCRKIFCPAMNTQMWDQHIVQNNINKLIDYGWEKIGPEFGRLACGTTGNGRLSDVNTIMSHINKT